MPPKPNKPCSSHGCPNLTQGRYCDDHKQQEKRYEKQRGSATSRGYNYKWAQYSKRFLNHPDNVICRLQLDGCTMLANCVDHIDPPTGSNDPRFWKTDNHQAACIHCNSVKQGRKKIKGVDDPFKVLGV